MRDMECDVCIGSGDDYGDEAEFFSETKRKARKTYNCMECGRQIVPGQAYVKIVGKWDGILDTIRQCVECNKIQKVFACGGGFLYGQLWEDMEQAFSSLRVTSPCFQKLPLPARQFLTEKWWEWKERNAER